MMSQQEPKAATIEEILAVADSPQAQKALIEIFGQLHPKLNEKKDLAEIFTPETVSEFITRINELELLLSEEDSFEQTLVKFQERINWAENLRDEVIGKLFKQLRPIEASYRQIRLFFENSLVPDGKQLMPIEFFIYNGDTAALKNRESITLEAIRRFVRSRNDNFNFLDDICNIVMPGPIPMTVREALEEEAWKWGMLLVTDLGDEKSLDDVNRQFCTGGRYEFLKRPDNKAASDVVIVSYLKLRDGYWFEKEVDGENDLYAPASVIFAGVLARTDRARDSVLQGPIGSKFGQIKGVDMARIECLISQMELLSMEMQMILIIRDADNHLCFYGCRSLADDPYGVYKFFTSYRVLAYLERVISNLLMHVAEQVLTRRILDEEIEKPICRFLEDQRTQGTIISYELFVDKNPNKRMQGLCDIFLEVMPTWSVEVFRVKLDVPTFKFSKRIYRFGKSYLILEFGDITASTAEVLVSSDNFKLTMEGGVSAAIRKAGGEAIIHDASKKIPASLGEVVITTAGALPAKFIFHAITIGDFDSDCVPKMVIEQITHHCLDLLETFNLSSIAFPILGAGAANFSYDFVVSKMAETISEHLRKSIRRLEVTIYLFDRFKRIGTIDFMSLFDEYAAGVPDTQDYEPKEIKNEIPRKAKSFYAVEEKIESVENADVDHRQGLVQQLASLGQERDQLETRLVVLKNGLSEEEIKGIQDRLKEIHMLRVAVLSEMHQPSKEGLAIFISYAHEDEELRVMLGKHLRALERQGLITSWHDRMISAGSKWKGVIDKNLKMAKIVLLLVSADFIDSDYCYDVEMSYALKRHNQGKGLVIPVILRPVFWKKTPFGDLQALPKDGKPVTEWVNQDLAFVNIAEGMMAAIEDILANP